MIELFVVAVMVGALASFVYVIIGAPEGVERRSYKDESHSRLRASGMIFKRVGQWAITNFDKWEEAHFRYLSINIKPTIAELERKILYNGEIEKNNEYRREINQLLIDTEKKRKVNPWKVLVCKFCLSTWISTFSWLMLYVLGIAMVHWILLIFLIPTSVLSAKYLN